MERRARLSPRVTLGLLLTGVALSYLFIITAGRWTVWWTWNTVYDLVAEGFRSGHLYTRLQPAPELVAAPDPFDPALHDYWIWDASFYKGHIFFYWGPLPALILAGIKTVLGWHFMVGDQYFVYWFFVINLAAGAYVIIQMARHVFPGLPRWMIVLGILVFAYSNPTPFIVATPGIYQAAIIGGQAFLLSGLAFAGRAIWGDPGGKPRRGPLLAAGVCWALGLATRVSIAPAVAILIALTVVLARPRGSGIQFWRSRLRTFLLLSIPVGVSLLALLVYNRARFDSFFDFGMSKQMSIMQFRTSLAYLPPNLYSYLWRPLVGSCEFPFLTAPFHMNGAEFPPGYVMPDGYWVGEPVAGMLRAAPWTWFVPVAVVLAGRVLWRWRVRRIASGLPLAAGAGRSPETDARIVQGWFVASFAVIAIVPGLPTLGQFIATMRYMVDVASGLTLLGMWGAWSLYEHARPRPGLRRLVMGAIVVTSVVTIVVGLLLGVSGYNDMFQKHNPVMFGRMVRAFSLCKGP